MGELRDNVSGKASHAGAGWVPVLVLTAGAFAIGFSPSFVRLSELGPLATAAHRVLLAVPVLFLWMRLIPESGRANRVEDWRDYWTFFLAGAFFAGDLAFWHWSITATSIANATLFATSTPIFVTLGAWLLYGEVITARFLAGVVVSLLGAAMLAGASFEVDPGRLIGDGFGVVAAMFFSGYLLTVKRLRMRFSAAVVMAWSSAATAVLLVPFALVAGESLIATSLRGWAVLAGLALISHAAGQGLVARAMVRLPASFTAVALLSETVFAAALAWLILGEAVTPLQGAGGLAILAGIALCLPVSPLRARIG